MTHDSLPLYIFIYITDNLYISKLQPSNPFNALCITMFTCRHVRKILVWFHPTLHRLGSNSCYKRFRLIHTDILMQYASMQYVHVMYFPLFHQTFKGFKLKKWLKKHQMHFWMHLTPHPWSMWGCQGLCLSLIWPVDHRTGESDQTSLGSREDQTSGDFDRRFHGRKGGTFLWPFFLGGNFNIQHKQIRINYIWRYDIFKCTYCHIVR